MTQDQVMGIIRQVLPFIGGVAVGKGWLTTSQMAGISDLVLQIAGPLFIVGGSIWAFFANSKASIIKSASAMPEVTSISTTSETLAASAKSADGSTTVRITQPKDVAQ